MEWLNGALYRAGVIDSGGVSSFRAELLESTNAHLASITLCYESGSSGTLPERLFLKMCEGGEFGLSEVDYYARDYADLPDAPIPQCFDAAYSPATGCYHVLMEDLSVTHRNNQKVTPTLAYGEAVAGALAVLHAHYWRRESVPMCGAEIPGTQEIDRYLDHVLPGIEPMLAASAGEIDPSWPELIKVIVDRHPTLMEERTRAVEGFTLVHGDVNPGNILSPRLGVTPVYLVDRQPFDWSLTTWLGVGDIAYMMVHWWETALRRRFELAVLRRYHDALIGRGVKGYAWDQLVSDYRLCAVQSLYVATSWCTDEWGLTTMKWVWFPQLRKTMAALVDLGCADYR
jgi:hypothetical protein